MSAAGGLEPLCTQLGIQLLVLFGSAARASTDPRDVDVAVRFRKDTAADLLGLLDALHALTGFEGYDVLDLARAGPVARERALVGCRLLYQARAGLFARAQIGAIMQRLDTDEMRRVELALLAR